MSLMILSTGNCVADHTGPDRFDEAAFEDHLAKRESTVGSIHLLHGGRIVTLFPIE